MITDLQQIDSYLQRRELKKAEVMIVRRLRDALPPQERAATLLMRARVRLFSGRIDDALADMAEVSLIDADIAAQPNALELRADCHFARFELASVGFADRADTLLALSLYEQLQRDHPEYENLGWVCYQQGRILLTESRVEEAITCLQHALIAPTIVPALTAYCYERLGFIAFYEQRDMKRALNWLNRAVDTFPAAEDKRWLAQVHTLRSRILREMRQHSAALEAAQTALLISGKDNKVGMADALLSAAEILADTPNGEREVIAYLQQFLQVSKRPLGIDVTWSRAHEMLGDAYAKTGQYSAAVAAYEAALQFNPYHPWEQSLAYRTARNCYYDGAYEKAARLMETMIANAEKDGDPITDFRVFSLLAHAYFALQRYGQAAAMYRRALDYTPASHETLPLLEHYHRLALDKRGKGSS